ncbi:MAG: hypothetical protein Q7R40_20165 [Phaeospirillum sp.]|nr:hypothetical protein [Phaeospirillum sp.]
MSLRINHYAAFRLKAAGVAAVALVAVWAGAMATARYLTPPAFGDIQRYLEMPWKDFPPMTEAEAAKQAEVFEPDASTFAIAVPLWREVPERGLFAYSDSSNSSLRRAGQAVSEALRLMAANYGASGFSDRAARRRMAADAERIFALLDDNVAMPGKRRWLPLYTRAVLHMWIDQNARAIGDLTRAAQDLEEEARQFEAGWLEQAKGGNVKARPHAIESLKRLYEAFAVTHLALGYAKAAEVGSGKIAEQDWGKLKREMRHFELAALYAGRFVGVGDRHASVTQYHLIEQPLPSTGLQPVVIWNELVAAYLRSPGYCAAAGGKETRIPGDVEWDFYCKRTDALDETTALGNKAYHALLRKNASAEMAAAAQVIAKLETYDRSLAKHPAILFNRALIAGHAGFVKDAAASLPAALGTVGGATGEKARRLTQIMRDLSEGRLPDEGVSDGSTAIIKRLALVKTWVRELAQGNVRQFVENKSNVENEDRNGAQFFDDFATEVMTVFGRHAIDKAGNLPADVRTKILSHISGTSFYPAQIRLEASERLGFEIRPSVPLSLAGLLTAIILMGYWFITRVYRNTFVSAHHLDRSKHSKRAQ